MRPAAINSGLVQASRHKLASGAPHHPGEGRASHWRGRQAPCRAGAGSAPVPSQPQEPQHPELQEGAAVHIPLPRSRQGIGAGHANHWATSGSSSYDSGMSSSGMSSTQPANHDLMASLKKSPHWGVCTKPALDLLDPDTAVRCAYVWLLKDVYVISFTSPDSEHNGVYSMRTLNAEGLPQDTIVAFETMEDTERYTCLLEVTMHPHIPSVSALAPHDLVEFCQERGYRCLLEPAGSLVVPPESSVETTDWERGKMLRHGQFSVLDEESYESMRDRRAF